MALGLQGAALAAYEEGTHYQKLPDEVVESEFAKELQAKEKDKVIVLEFFSYGCSWCYKIEPLRRTIPEKIAKQRSLYSNPR